MNNEEFNKKYFDYYEKDLPKTNKQIEHRNQVIQDCRDDLIIYKGMQKSAEKNNNPQEVQKYQDLIDKTIEKLHKNQDLLKKIEERNDRDRAIIEPRVEEMKKDPQMNIALLKRYNRANKKMEKQKQKIESFANLLSEHPSLNNAFKGMLIANSELKKINEVLPKLEEKMNDQSITGAEYSKLLSDVKAYRQKEKDAKSKLQKNSKILLDYKTKNHLDFTLDEIDEMANHGFRKSGTMLKDKDGKVLKDSNGNAIPDIDVQKTLKNQIKGIDKNISYNERSQEKLIKELGGIDKARKYLGPDFYESMKGNLPARIVKLPWYKRLGNFMKKLGKKIVGGEEYEEEYINSTEAYDKDDKESWKGKLRVDRVVMKEKENELSKESRKEVREEEAAKKVDDGREI